MQERSQKEVLKDIFEQKGITNHIQATYYNKLGNQILAKGPENLKELFPVLDASKQDETWEMGYTLVLDYLGRKNMTKTKETATQFVNGQNPNKAATVEKLGLPNTSSSPLSDLIRDQKMYLLFNSDNFDYDLPPSYYLSKQ
ncbi:hypothetical protein TVAG_066500 [Trichomonas vaginalis G3]|uniref:Uncharacterized protein n=1 Tax=Trichomonas vaginalis (strain ATCC PRA-98 / G3) TaxID=412133 RepID=A2FFI3_TRIV3|nr:hypothetical protein TVAGG3_0545350 [Trichomonas vaginalis G3]EAX96353.1 hypothetical protein TVAG_066500 [Trichomonas vaginalis G3]KAI5520138.1 hypothetical protein TVAGG3_0545350 [Trichomonas vaginalis G3]|eukprot:XP_001309283.1 hypothetical protein [Trichomonas vaginalis G3]